ncbi:S8 family serine peptidase [Oscillochloris sp. ZM17-4]|uniref:S8 family serine peptidase n=1 Tax=Oscillochloris sp. ZM17-4 TaxID=2866714 RepID=UPI001C72D432|nr:S8 family serine peptidase [Oscillochloris sp. ZM17-4]MBX0329503.1 S8 family serine peptidase [Oscillochloris sp. ZM17-4]
MTTYRRRSVTLLLRIITLIASAAAAVAPRDAIASVGTPLTSAPPAISASVALGSTKRVTLSLHNTSGATVTPRLYEALAASAATASLTTALPADLRAASLPDQAQRIDPQLSAAAAAAPDSPADFLVFLGDQADLSAAYAISDWDQRGQYVYETLRDHAERSQTSLRALLDARGATYTPLWIVNALAVHGDAADIAALAARPEVAMLRASHLMAFGEDTPADAALDSTSGCLPDAANTCWNIVRVGADRVWNNFGVRGAGITVASIDSGVDYTHPALVGQYRGNAGGGVFDHSYNWYDPFANSPSPTDSGYHGTHTMGTMVASGGASASAPAVGVAPGARWIAARACDASQCSETTLIEAAQWLLAPTDPGGQNPRTDLRPQIISNSWSSGSGGNDWYAGYVAAWRAAGIFPVFAAGNSGNSSGCSSIQSPADYAQVVGVGALDNGNLIASYSDIGPSADGRLKPDISAPGSGIVSTSPGSITTYRSLSGTSMATPHVAGSVALLWAANPSLIGDYDRTYQILTDSAVPISGDARFDGGAYDLCHAASSPNNIYGYGQLDVYAAVAEASVDVPWLSLPAAGVSPIGALASASVDVTLDTAYVPGPGTYQARIIVHDADLTHEPLVIPVTLTVPADLSYATVSGRLTRLSDGSTLVGSVSVAGGATVSSDAGGAYSLMLPPSATSYTLTAQSPGYAPQSVSFPLGSGESRSYDFALDTDAPRLDASTTIQTATVALGTATSRTFILRNNGTKDLTYSASVITAQYGVWRSDQSDGPTALWISPPADATTLALPDDGVSGPISLGFAFPFFNQSYTAAWVGANGFISFASLSGVSTSYLTGCLPLSETPDAALIPLRVDLDPAQPGARVSYAQTAGGFLVSWEDVPLFNDLSTRMSFQALLRPDGRATLNYKRVDALSPTKLASAGVQQSSASVQSLGCGSSLRVSSGQTIELRPQPSTAIWAALPSPTGSIAPGGQASLPVQLSWARSTVSWPASADILIQSNDPMTPSTTVSVRVSALGAPQTIYMPYIPVSYR